MQEWEGIFKISNEQEFNNWALKVFAFQLENTQVYREFCTNIGRTNPSHWTDIPFLPISFFKTKQVSHRSYSPALIFKSSGTTGAIRSHHPVVNALLYETSFLATYRSQIGEPSDQVILALLPSYIEQGESSLVYMVDALIRETKNPLSGFLLQQSEQIIERYQQAIATGKRVVIFGVSYALLDLANQQIDLSKALVIETGGMKGRRKEMTKNELHAYLKKCLGVKSIASEYGMTELLSQGYALKEGLFTLPPWMKVQLREVNDPFSKLTKMKTGGIQVVDLANVFSCSFIDTQDLGRLIDGKLELMGRYDQADLRGCNLLVH